jgi:hypothetical protein
LSERLAYLGLSLQMWCRHDCCSVVVRPSLSPIMWMLMCLPLLASQELIRFIPIFAELIS